MAGYNASIVQRIEISPGLIIIRVVPDQNLFDFKPGQYTVLGLMCKEPRLARSGLDAEDSKCIDNPDRIIKRAYSISSSSLDKDFIEFYIALVDSGELTPRLFNLKIGDRLFLGPKSTGLFTLQDVPSHKNVLLISTGTGLAPYISMIRSLLDCNKERRFVVLNGARYSWDLGYRDELNSVERYCPNLIYIPAVSRPDEDPTWKGLAGRIQPILESGVVEERSGLEITPDNFDIFLCGNPGMIEGVMAIMEAKGFVKGDKKNPGNMHVEEYW